MVALCTDVSQKSVKLNSANKQRGFLNMQGWLQGFEGVTLILVLRSLGLRGVSSSAGPGEGLLPARVDT